MAIKAFKDIIDNKGYRINTNDRKIFEEGTLESFFGFGDKDAIEFIIYDANDNQLPQINDELVRYIPLNTQNIREYFLIPEGTIFQKYQFPTEYFIDIERLLREAGYDNGIFKTQVTLINKRVGSEVAYDKLWISEISPSRTEVRLYPLKRGLETNEELEKRFKLFIKNGQFRDDTINLVFNFIEKISPSVIDTFLQTKYTEKWFNKMVGEYKIKDFDIFSQKVYEKFIESTIYEFTNRVSIPTSNNYGKPKKSKPSIELSVAQIRELCKSLLIHCIDFYLLQPDVRKEANYDTKTDTSVDVVNKVLQRLESDTIIDTRPPERKIAQIIKPDIKPIGIKLKQDIIKQLPIDSDSPPPKIKTPVEDPSIVVDMPPPILIEAPVDEAPVIKFEPTKDVVKETPMIGGGGGGGGGRGIRTIEYQTPSGEFVAQEYNMDYQK